MDDLWNVKTIKISVENIMEKSKEIDVFLRQHCEDIVDPGRWKQIASGGSYKLV